jgi:hypothetical protein
MGSNSASYSGLEGFGSTLDLQAVILAEHFASYLSPCRQILTMPSNWMVIGTAAAFLLILTYYLFVTVLHFINTI